MRWTAEVEEALDELVRERMIKLLEQAVRQQPTVTAASLLSLLQDEQRQEGAVALQYGICGKCGKRVLTSSSNFVTHVDEAGYVTNRGCRAASFDPDSGWDDRLPRTWTATWSGSP